MEKLHSTEKTAEMLSQPVGTLRYWRHIGKGPKCARIGRRVMYRESDIRAWIDAQFAAADNNRPTTPAA